MITSLERLWWTLFNKGKPRCSLTRKSHLSLWWLLPRWHPIRIARSVEFRVWRILRNHSQRMSR